MGLAGRKQKQRIPADPRNLTWADDASRFGLAYLSKFGWDASQGLGSTAEGTKTHVKVQQKLDMMGIGAQHQRDPNGIAWKQNKDFEALLKRLNENGDQKQDESEERPSTAKKRKREEEGGKQKKEKPLDDAGIPSSTMPKPRPMAHRARIRAAKSIADKSASAISEILGIPSSSSASSGDATPPSSTPAPLSLGTLTTSSKSVTDYFKEKLGRSLSSSGSASPAVVPQVEELPRRGIGSRAPAPYDDDEELPRRGIGNRAPIPYTPVVDTQPEQDPSAEKRRRKAERKAEKQRRQAEAEAAPTPGVTEEDDLNTSEEKRKRKKKRAQHANRPGEDEPQTSKKSKKERS